MDKETKWLIVKFDKKNKVDAVPAKWYIHDIKKCYWPPKKISHKTSEYVKVQQEPDESWKTYDATILGSFDNLEGAQRKIEKAKISDRLTSNDETFKKKKNCSRKKILKKASVPKSSSSSSDITSISVESDINTYPTEINMEAIADTRSISNGCSGISSSRRMVENNGKQSKSCMF
ncbi:hypothetical protein PUN28_010434 [Cardiocondyla obscurior]|uniref:Uncharacterized protein n=1 Tax=Cardiocondyla obscurior TaxID=286306 RepID=A0AAW2FJG7_9HYME